MGKLTALQVKAAKAPGKYVDGQGLMLAVKPGGSRTWILRIQANGRRRDISLGTVDLVGLSEAREKAMETRKLIRAGIDPVEARKASQRASEAISGFEQVARKVFEERKGDWRNPKHRAQWLSTMEAYVFPHIGRMTIEAVTSASVRELLVPIWQSKPETARRVLQRVCAVLNWAYSNGMRANPAPKEAIRSGLGKQIKRAEHFAALPLKLTPPLLKKLERESTAGRLALRFVILTAARSGEVRKAKWNEMDLKAGIWTIPAERMKAGREHTVPLSKAARKGLKEAQALRTSLVDAPVFPGLHGQALSDTALTKALRSDCEGKWTVHGFRSTFRDWAEDCTSYPFLVTEAALAHTVKNKTTAAYVRTDHFERRRDMMRDWADFLTAVPNESAAAANSVSI